MIVINKKRIQIILSCILIAIFTFYFQIAKNQEQLKQNSQEENPNTIATTATPVSGKTIVVDAGHGVPDERSRK